MTSNKRRMAIWLGALLILVSLGIVGAYTYVKSGGMIARQKPTSIEVAAARWIVDLSVPRWAKELNNPLGATATSVNVLAGRELYKQKCEVCHGYDGSGGTEAGAGQYPPPVDLRGPEVSKASDGEVFYFIRNGIRNTAMPGWQLPDLETWRLVAFVRSLPKGTSLSSAAPAAGRPSSATFVGSAACKSCHADIHQRWTKTLMANVARDPKEHPDAIIPDLSIPNPLVTFSKDDIAIVYGTKWKQRYFKKIGDDFFPLPAQWDVTHKVWRVYNVKPGTDWWTKFYGTDNLERPTGPLCDGCHAVNYNIQTKTVSEWNVGCEKCHGPGGDHVKQPLPSNIWNPTRMDYVQANDTCIQCHSQGQPPTKPIQGKYYDWPVGFQVGLKLADFWNLEEHKPGETTFTHFADGTAHKNRMQGNDFVGSLMYARGVTCFSCHDAHGTENNALLRKPGNDLCLDCHGPSSPNGPHAPSIEQHSRHKTGSTGNECVGCHMPKIAQTIADVNVRSHTFKFIPPSATDTLKVPNSCNSCHTDKTVQWTKDTLKTWKEFSPWRVLQ